MISDIIAVVGMTLCSLGLAELFSWWFVYSTDSYKRACARTRALVDKLEQDKTQPKKVAAYKAELKELAQQTTGTTLKTTFATIVNHWFFYTLLSSLFDGVVVARLPFVPIWLVQGLAHRGLLVSADSRECGFLFLFTLTTLSRTTLQKFLGFEAPKNPVSGWDAATSGSSN